MILPTGYPPAVPQSPLNLPSISPSSFLLPAAQRFLAWHPTTGIAHRPIRHLPFPVGFGRKHSQGNAVSPSLLPPPTLRFLPNGHIHSLCPPSSCPSTIVALASLGHALPSFSCSWSPSSPSFTSLRYPLRQWSAARTKSRGRRPRPAVRSKSIRGVQSKASR